MVNVDHRVYVGIDIHSRKHRVGIMPRTLLEREDAAWRNTETFIIENKIDDFQHLDAAIKSHSASPEQVAIAVDHTGGHYSEPIVYFLLKQGYRVYHLETKAVKAIRERFLDQENKSDTIDAIGSAYILYLRDTHGISFRIAPVSPQLNSTAALFRSLILERQRYAKMASQATNRLHHFLLAVFPEGEARYFPQLLRIIDQYPTPEHIRKSNNLKEIKLMRKVNKESILELAYKTVGIPGKTYERVIKALSAQRTECLAQCDSIDSMLREELLRHPYGCILLSFPQIGEVSAATIIGIVQDIERWPTKQKLKKALGIYGRISQSGKGSGRARQGKEGSRAGRRVLFQICFGSASPRTTNDSDFKDYYLRQVARGKPRMKALVSTMGKLAEIIYHCLQTGETYVYQGVYKKVRNAAQTTE